MMSRPGFRSRTMNVFCTALLVAAAAAPILVAGMRGAGKYTGVVFYDRWNNCYLFSGVYLMYISEAVKESLRPYRGKSMEIDAKEVYQPMNPDDGLIKKLEVIGESREDLRPINRAPPIRGVELRAAVSSVSDRFRAIVEIRNNSSANVPIESDALGFAVIAHDKPFVCPSDGTSCAVITRISATTPDGENRIDSQTWGWAFGVSRRLPKRFTLGPGEVRTTSVVLSLPNGRISSSLVMVAESTLDRVPRPMQYRSTCPADDKMSPCFGSFSISSRYVPSRLVDEEWI